VSGKPREGGGRRGGRPGVDGFVTMLGAVGGAVQSIALTRLLATLAALLRSSVFPLEDALLTRC